MKRWCARRPCGEWAIARVVVPSSTQAFEGIMERYRVIRLGRVGGRCYHCRSLRFLLEMMGVAPHTKSYDPSIHP
jgi:hypothetical protein